MSELGRPFLHPDVRRLIESDRNAPDPPDSIKRRVGERLDQSLGLGGAIIAAAPGLGLSPPSPQDSSTPSVPPPPATLFGWKALAGAAVAVVVGGAAVLSFASRARMPTAPVEGPERLGVVVEMAPLQAPLAGPSQPVAGDPAVRAAETEALVPRATHAGESAATRSARHHRAASRATGIVDTLAAERTVLDGARSALVHHDASGALAALRSHEQAFPRGQLLEERESMRVQALSLAHDFAAARAVSERFRRRFPRSMFLPAVEQALEAAP